MRKLTTAMLVVVACACFATNVSAAKPSQRQATTVERGLSGPSVQGPSIPTPQTPPPAIITNPFSQTASDYFALVKFEPPSSSQLYIYGKLADGVKFDDLKKMGDTCLASGATPPGDIQELDSRDQDRMLGQRIVPILYYPTGSTPPFHYSYVDTSCRAVASASGPLENYFVCWRTAILPADRADVVSKFVSLYPDETRIYFRSGTGCSDYRSPFIYWKDLIPASKLTTLDIDADGVITTIEGVPVDNCPMKFNPDQKDSNGNGIGDACEPPATCIPKTCTGLGATCGTPPDGCGGALAACGTCPEEKPNCGSDYKCGTVACAAKTCADLGKNCGVVSDGCSGTVDCGTCGDGQTCTDNVCVASGVTEAAGAASTNEGGSGTSESTQGAGGGGGGFCTLMPTASANPSALLFLAAALLPLVRRRAGK